MVDTSELRICFMDVLRQPNMKGVTQLGNHLFSEIAKSAASHEFIPTQAKGKEELEISDQNKVRELFWAFIIQGTLMPDGDALNVFTLTEYGRDVLSSPDPIPHDPDGYLKHLAEIAPNLDPVVTTYVNEGLDCFLRGNYTASIVMLGVGSEKVILELARTLQQFLNGSEATNMQKSIDKDKVSLIYKEFKKRFTPRMSQLPQSVGDGIEGQIDGIFEIIRTHRNEAGHPTGQFFDRLTALGLFSIFPFYCKRISQLMDYLKSGTI